MEDWIARNGLQVVRRERLRALDTDSWFDMDQLEAGDNWDQKIRLNVQRCTVFLPLISPETERRLEGYFRREWKAAALRTEAIADGLPFIMPLVIDPAMETAHVRHVPDAFRVPQWMHFEGPNAIPQRYLDSVAASHRLWLSHPGKP